VKSADILKAAIGAFLFPQACVLCDHWVVNSRFSPLCSDCLGSLRPIRGPVCDNCGVPIPGNLLDLYAVCSSCREQGFSFSKARSWGPYEAGLRKLIQAFKFGGRPRLVAPISELLRCCQSEHFPDSDLIVPVPLHPKKKRERGFDQTLLLAKYLSARGRIPLLRCVNRKKYTRPQFGLNHADRRRNLRGAFGLSNRHQLDGKRILLVDDVMTTGATVEEVSRVLYRDARPFDVEVITVARAVRRLEN
jgi:ComF family protein